MIKIRNVEVCGWDAAIRGMRNPMNSWDKSDSGHYIMVYDPSDEGTAETTKLYADYHDCELGPNDLKLATALANGTGAERKFLRMIQVYMDIKAPLYWWKEFDTYKVGTVADSCSTMHKIAEKKFEIDDFSFEHLRSDVWNDKTHDITLEYVDKSNKKGYRENCLGALYAQYIEPGPVKVQVPPLGVLSMTIDSLNRSRDAYLEAVKEKNQEDAQMYWWQMIQLLPTSYNQLRTVNMNYEVLKRIYRDRRHHKLDEWRIFCKEIEKLPYAKELIIGEDKRKEVKCSKSANQELSQ